MVSHSVVERTMAISPWMAHVRRRPIIPRSGSAANGSAAGASVGRIGSRAYGSGQRQRGRRDLRSGGYLKRSDPLPAPGEPSLLPRIEADGLLQTIQI